MRKLDRFLTGLLQVALIVLSAVVFALALQWWWVS